MRRSALRVGLAVVTLATTIGTAGASPANPPVPGPERPYCVVHVVDQRASGELVTSTPRCYETRRASMEAEGVGVRGAPPDQVVGLPEAPADPAAASATFTIGYHCDGYNLAAPCTSVVGTGCTGGWLNTSVAWANRISSTQNGCPTVRHHDGPNLTGAAWTTTVMAPSWTNLTSFNNRTESLQYS